MSLNCVSIVVLMGYSRYNRKLQLLVSLINVAFRDSHPLPTRHIRRTICNTVATVHKKYKDLVKELRYLPRAGWANKQNYESHEQTGSRAIALIGSASGASDCSHSAPSLSHLCVFVTTGTDTRINIITLAMSGPYRILSYYVANVMTRCHCAARCTNLGLILMQLSRHGFR